MRVTLWITTAIHLDTQLSKPGTALGSAELNSHWRFSAVVTIRSKAKIYATPDPTPAQVVALLRASIDAEQVAVGVVGEPGRAIQRIEHKGSRVKVS